MALTELLPSTCRSFFDWASTSPLSLAASAAREKFIRLNAATGDPPRFLRSETAKLSTLRELLCQMLCARATDRIVLSRSAAELLSLLAVGLPRHGRDAVVLVGPNHPVLELAWLGAARRSPIRVISVPADGSYRADVGKVREAVDSTCLAVCVTHVTHLHGGVQPIAELADLAHRAGALLIVDGAQAVGRIAVDLAKLDCDFYVGVGRKALLSPPGTAFLAADLELLSMVEPTIWSTRSTYTVIGSTRYGDVLPPPAGLEGNLPDLSALGALEASVRAILAVGLSTVQQQVQDVLPTVYERLTRIGLVPLSPLPNTTRNAGILTFDLPRPMDGSELQVKLRASGHIIAADDRTIRISLHVSNGDADVEVLAEEVSRYAAECGC